MLIFSAIVCGVSVERGDCTLFNGILIWSSTVKEISDCASRGFLNGKLSVLVSVFIEVSLSVPDLLTAQWCVYEVRV